MALTGIAYASFGWAGKLILRLYPGLAEDIKASGIRVYPEAYASLVAMLTFLGFALGLALGIPAYLLPKLGFLPALHPSLALLVPLLSMTGLPLFLFIATITYPKMKSFTRTSKLDLEIPYLAVYISVMATGGISPYVSMERLAKAPKFLFDELRKEAMKFYLRIRALGEDPLTAIEESAKEVPNRQYKELMLGYASTLRIGGDVVHFLHRQTEMMLKERVSQVKAVAERIATLMEGYMAIVILTSLTIYTLFVVNMALAQAGFALGGSEIQFVVFAYILMPMLSGLFIYLADLMQPSYPVYDTMPYKVYFGVSLPITIVLILGMCLPFMLPPGTPASVVLSRAFSPTVTFVESIVKRANLPGGFEAGIGLCIAFMVGLIPSILAHIRSTIVHGGIQHGVTLFLRDLVEVRKTGLPPEKCIMNLSGRDYGRFTKHLREIARQVGWGVPLSRIYERFARKTKNWLALITMYLLVDSIEVGGGTPETLETLATYAETLESLERDKKRMLRPLLLIPYIGAIIIVVVVLVLVGFMNQIMTLAHMTIGTKTMVSMFLPPVIINSYLMGLTAGKISSERVSAGFVHAFLLTLASLAAMLLTPHIVRSLMIPVSL